MKKAVFALSNSESQAQKLVESLIASGISEQDISILFPDHNKQKVRAKDYYSSGRDTSNERDLSRGSSTTEKNAKSFKHTDDTAGTRDSLSGSLSSLSGVASLEIPRLGSFIAAGPIVRSISEFETDSELDLLTEVLAQFGIPENEARRYQEGLRSGSVLISIFADSDTELRKATELLKRESAREITTTREKAQSKH